jgi:hypothetical protein
MALAKDIETNRGLIIIHQQNSAQDAENLAKGIGTVKSKQITAQIGETGSTGVGSMRETREFIIHPDDIKQLKQGSAVIYNTTNFAAVKIVSRYSKFLKKPEVSKEST